MSGRLVWDRDGRDWPNRAASRFVRAGGLQWHVQVAGAGPVLLLVHGTGASTHSWRALMPLLAADFTVVAPDLPGHGFTDTPARPGFTLPGMARGVAALLRALSMAPVLAAGHSAGAAVVAQMCLDNAIAPDVLASLNGALLPWPGAPTGLFAPVARAAASAAPTAWLFACFVRGGKRVDRLLRSTGSTIDEAGARLYARLAGNPVHVGGALKLMANWDLRPLARELPRLRPHLILVSGEKDGMVPPAEARRLRDLVPGAEVIELGRLGHLAHEERPDDVAALLRRASGL